MIALLLPLATRLVGERFAKLAAWAFVALFVAALIGAAVWWFTDTVDDARSEGVKAGVTAERAEAQEKVIDNVKAAKDAGDRYRADPAQRDAGCLLDATAPEDC